MTEFIQALKDLGAQLGMRLKGYRSVKVHFGSGQLMEVVVPYFAKAAPKGRRRARRRGSYLGSEVLGFLRRWRLRWVSEVAQAALLCPSLEVAHAVLERRRKRGRKKAGLKRQGYSTDWKEPKLFTVYVPDNEGRVVKSFAPLHDATMRNHEGLFALLERYLDALELERVARIVFCGDGAPWIWSGVKALCQRRGLDPERVEQVIDYTHAKQNRQALIDLLPTRLQREGRLAKQWRNWLWQGDLKALDQLLCEMLQGKKKAQALTKWDNYFARNQKRLHYARFRELAVPCGSGCVESAIRRVINLRLKAPGTFWTPEMAECFLFLPSQLLSGRWDTFIKNVARLKTRLLKPLQHAAPIAQSHADEYLQAA